MPVALVIHFVPRSVVRSTVCLARKNFDRPLAHSLVAVQLWMCASQTRFEFRAFESRPGCLGRQFGCPTGRSLTRSLGALQLWSVRLPDRLALVNFDCPLAHSLGSFQFRLFAYTCA